MAALTANRITQSKDLGAIRRYEMAQSTTIFSGSMVMINSAGLATPATAAAGNNGVVGVATESVTSVAAAGTFIKVQEGLFLFVATSIVQGNVGELMFATDDQTVDETQGANEPQAGKLAEFVTTTSGWVQIGLDMAS